MSPTSTLRSRSSRCCSSRCASSTASRTGRAWRSLREDPLAAQLMGMPVPWLKLMAFSFGAAIAALTGTLFVALNGAVFPGNFDLTLLITIYAMMILGGPGSQAGAVLGAILISVSRVAARAGELPLHLLRRAPARPRRGRSGSRFASPRRRRGHPSRGRGPALVVDPIDSSWTGAAPDGGLARRLVAQVGRRAGRSRAWLKAVAYISWSPCPLLTTSARLDALAVLVPTLYLAAFVWENVLAVQPEATRYILLGALLVVVMIVRPNGLLGEKRVEIV